MGKELNIVQGDLIKLALLGKFDVITHGCNCFCTMGAGIAVPMAKTFGVDKYTLEHPSKRGSISKLGNIETKLQSFPSGNLYVVNSYTQYYYGKNHKDGMQAPLDYAALELCFRKINHCFKGLKLGLPLIGCGLAGGNLERVLKLMKDTLTDVDLTVVAFSTEDYQKCINYERIN